MSLLSAFSKWKNPPPAPTPEAEANKRAEDAENALKASEEKTRELLAEADSRILALEKERDTFKERAKLTDAQIAAEVAKEVNLKLAEKAAAAGVPPDAVPPQNPVSGAARIDALRAELKSSANATRAGEIVREIRALQKEEAGKANA